MLHIPNCQNPLKLVFNFIHIKWCVQNTSPVSSHYIFHRRNKPHVKVVASLNINQANPNTVFIPNQQLAPVDKLPIYTLEITQYPVTRHPRPDVRAPSPQTPREPAPSVPDMQLFFLSLPSFHHCSMFALGLNTILIERLVVVGACRPSLLLDSTAHRLQTRIVGSHLKEIMALVQTSDRVRSSQQSVPWEFSHFFSPLRARGVLIYDKTCYYCKFVFSSKAPQNLSTTSCCLSTHMYTKGTRELLFLILLL